MIDKPRTTAIIKSGLLSSNSIEEMRRWGLPLDWFDEAEVEVASTPEQVIGIIEQALESDEVVKLRDSDLDVIRRYLTDQKTGRLNLYDSETEEKGNFKVNYCMTQTGEVVIPWRAESMADLITDPKSYLKTEEGTRIVFCDVRELFFGGQKAFMVATPREDLTDGST